MKDLPVLIFLLIPSIASAQTAPLCRAASGTVACAQPLLLAYIPSNIPASRIASGSTLSGVTINCSSNTCQAIANSSLVNSSFTLSCTGLSGCGAVSLGGSGSLAVMYGTGSGTAAQGNDVRIPAAPSGAGGTLIDNGSAWIRLAPGAANSLYQSNGVASESWVSTLTGITINGAANTLTVRLANDVAGVLPIASGGIGSATGDAGSLINIPGGQVIGNVPVAAITSALAAGTVAINGTTITASTSVVTPTIGPAGNQHMIPGGTANIVTLDSSGALTNKSIDGSEINSGTVLDARLPTTMAGKTLTTATVTSPAISGPTVTGTISGARTEGSGLTLGANVAAAGYKFTGIGAPTAASSDSATALYAETVSATASAASKVGGIVTIAQTSATGTWASGENAGPLSNQGGTSASFLNFPGGYWSPVVAGTLKNCGVKGSAAPNSTVTVTIRQSPYTGGVTATALTWTVPSTASYGADTNGAHAVTVAAQDNFVATLSTASWSSAGAVVTCQFTPSLP